MNRQGVALIISYMVIAVLVLLGSVFLFQSVSESNITRRYVDSTQAFWTAEAGIAQAIEDFPQSPLNDYLIDDNNTYNTLTSLVAGFTDRYRITSTGSFNTGTRTIEVIVQQPQSGDIDNSISTTGDLTIQGSADVEEPYESDASFTFQEVFGMTEATVKAQADHLYTDPPNNVTPVDGITWIEVAPGEEVHISQNGWEGSGILIVEGDLRITGGDFSGIIWTSGNLFVAGNPDIEGAIFVNCGENETTLTGNADIDYDADVIDDAFGSLSPVILSWYEL